MGWCSQDLSEMEDYGLNTYCNSLLESCDSVDDLYLHGCNFSHFLSGVLVTFSISGS